MDALIDDAPKTLMRSST